MEVKVAKTAGFCFGVSRAVKMAEEAAEKGPVSVLGELIHNPSVTGNLRKLGVTVLSSPEEAGPDRTVIIRSHGVGRAVLDLLARRGVPTLDATCPFVARIHRIAAAAPPDALVVIAGKREHPEVQGILGHTDAPARVVRNRAEWERVAAALEDTPDRQVFLVAQTTFSQEEWDEIVGSAKKECTNLKVFDTICRATARRQEEAKQLAAAMDAMVVVGGKNSSNTAELFRICEARCPTVWVEEGNELASPGPLFRKAHRIGITAGASTPTCIIKEVQSSMSEMENEMTEESFGELLDQYDKSVRNGEKVTATVTDIKPNEVVVDAGTKHACYVPLDQLTRDPSAKPEDVVSIGDRLDLIVIRVNDLEGTAVLSKTRMDSMAGFEKVVRAGETGEVLSGVVTEVVKGGLLVLTNGVKIFVPASHSGIPRDGDLSVLLHQEVRFKILETNRQRRRAVGSISLVLREERKELARKFWETVEVGRVYTGRVKSLTNFGAFVDLGGIDGRIGLTDLTWLRVKHPSEVVSIGDTVEVTVKDIDREKNRVSLIYKKPEDNPWEKIRDLHQVGDVLRVKIMSLTAFGAFAQIIPGIDGLIHISQIARERVEKPSDRLSVGEVVEAKIIELDYERKRASLSIKALLPEEPGERGARETAARRKAPRRGKAPAEAVPAAETPVREVPAAEAPAEEPPAEAVPAEETPVREVPVGEVPAGEAPAAEVPAEEAPAAEVPAEEPSAGAVPAEEAPAAEVPAEEAPAAEVPAEEAPAAEVPAGEVPAEELPAGEETPSGE